VVLTGEGDETVEMPLPMVEPPQAATPDPVGASSRSVTIAQTVVERHPSAPKSSSTTIKYDHNAVEGYSTKLVVLQKETS
jgi:hypothetical protein